MEQKGKRELFVKVFTNEDMIQLYEVRAGLEATALIICIEKLSHEEWEETLSLFNGFSLPINELQIKEYQKKDREFHSSILKLSENNLILEFIERCEFILRCYQKGLLRDPNETLPEHQAIVEAIRAKDSDLAQKRIMEHHWKTREVLKTF